MLYAVHVMLYAVHVMLYAIHVMLYAVHVMMYAIQLNCNVLNCNVLNATCAKFTSASCDRNEKVRPCETWSRSHHSSPSTVALTTCQGTSVVQALVYSIRSVQYTKILSVVPSRASSCQRSPTLCCWSDGPTQGHHNETQNLVQSFQPRSSEAMEQSSSICQRLWLLVVLERI